MKLFRLSMPLTLITSFRFFGLFVVIPILPIYATSLGASPVLTGLAVGGYALTQIIFQIPFGILSDRFDKRYIIAIGLVIFAIGSLLCAFSEDIYLLIAGRLLQGCGAISSVISALLADLTPDEDRTKAMAIMGAGISLSFLLAMLVGPIIGGHYGIKILFDLSAIGCGISLLFLMFSIPKGTKVSYSYLQIPNAPSYLVNPSLWMMYLSAFLQKTLGNISLVLIPLVLFKDFSVSANDLWKFYAPAGIIGVLALAPASIFAEKYGHYKSVMIIGILCFGICFSLYSLSGALHSLWILTFGVVVFLTGFNIHEPIMQSLSSKYPKASQRGASLGMLTTFGFLGSFCGPILGGILYAHLELSSIALLAWGVCAIWILSLLFLLQNPPKQAMLYIPFNPSNLQKIQQIDGIVDYYHTQETLVIKYDISKIDENTIKENLK